MVKNSKPNLLKWNFQPREGEVKGRMIWAIDKFMKTTAERQSADLETGEVKWRVRLLYQPDGNPQESLHMYVFSASLKNYFFLNKYKFLR